ncbi:hypothetical protein J6590_023900 [Homalodisca vitripennis]|nr:hypothetical protein J6590_023900 [Homalodisca vitripennis]
MIRRTSARSNPLQIRLYQLGASGGRPKTTVLALLLSSTINQSINRVEGIMRSFRLKPTDLIERTKRVATLESLMAFIGGLESHSTLAFVFEYRSGVLIKYTVALVG